MGRGDWRTSHHAGAGVGNGILAEVGKMIKQESGGNFFALIVFII
jgi:hypothetical protein